MRKLTLVLLLLAPACLSAEKPNPADFTVTVHVVSSANAIYGGGGVNSYQVQVLETTIDGQAVQLRGGNGGLLPLGDYRARVAPKFPTPHNPNSYDIYKGYDLLMPDGSVRTYGISRLGPVVPATVDRK